MPAEISRRVNHATLHLILTVLLVCLTLSLADENEKRLVRDLMRNYDKRIRPVANASQVVNVTLGLALAQLIDVDEKNQIITTNCWLNQAWLDNELIWDPEQYGGITTILLPYDQIWLPDIILYNNADVTSSKTSSVSTNVMVTNKGNVTWLSTVIYMSSCTMDVRYFPFDEQNCSMLFASWTYDGSQLNLTLVDSEGDLSNYLPSSEFELVDLYVERHIKYYSCCVHPYPDITYYVHMRRRPLFYVFNMLLPCCLITLVALLGFYIPSDSGEKVTMGITTLLSMTVFLMLVTEAMPPTADHLPLIGIYYFITIGIVSLATAMTVCTLNIHHKGIKGRPVPAWIRFICFRLLAVCLCIPIDPLELDYEYEVWGNQNTFQASQQRHPKVKVGIGECEEKLLSVGVASKLEEFHMEQKLPSAKADKGNGHAQAHCRDPPSSRNSWKINTAPSRVTNDVIDTKFLKVLKSISDSIKRNEQRLAEQDRRDVIKQQWQQVALVVDRLLLLIFVLLTLAVTSGLIMKGAIFYL